MRQRCKPSGYPEIPEYLSGISGPTFPMGEITGHSGREQFCRARIKTVRDCKKNQLRIPVLQRHADKRNTHDHPAYSQNQGNGSGKNFEADSRHPLQKPRCRYFTSPRIQRQHTSPYSNISRMRSTQLRPFTPRGKTEALLADSKNPEKLHKST